MGIEAIFTSELLSGNPSLQGAATELGGHHFNWYQIVTSSDRKAFDAQGNELKVFPWVDLPVGGITGVGEPRNIRVWSDDLPWKYLEVKKPAELASVPAPVHWTQKVSEPSFSIRDTPSYAYKNNTYAEFKTWLVSVNQDSSLVQFLAGFSWKSSNPNGKDGVSNVNVLPPLKLSDQAYADEYKKVVQRMGFKEKTP